MHKKYCNPNDEFRDRLIYICLVGVGGGGGGGGGCVCVGGGMLIVGVRLPKEAALQPAS